MTDLDTKASRAARGVTAMRRADRLEQPLRYELLTLERLADAARALAARQRWVAPEETRVSSPLPRVVRRAA